MKRISAVLTVLLATLPAARAQQATAPADRPAESQEVLAAQSLRHSAESLLHAPKDTPARAARLVALAEYAAALDGADARNQALLADIYEVQDNISAAARATEVAYSARPGDYSLGLRWMRLRLATLDDAETRLDFLAAVAELNIPAALQ